MSYLIVENDTGENNSKIQKINEHVRNKKPVVIYFYKDGCPFCENTTPEWNKLPNYLSSENNLLVTRINKLLYEKLHSIGEKPSLYPNIRYINGSYIDTFKKEGEERNAKNLAMWIQQQPKNSIETISEVSIQPIQRNNNLIESISIQPIQKQKLKKNNRFSRKNKNKRFTKKRKRKNNKFTKRRRNYHV
jgi:thiol-disulfide isomerase/thioredoxin